MTSVRVRNPGPFAGFDDHNVGITKSWLTTTSSEAVVTGLPGYRYSTDDGLTAGQYLAQLYYPGGNRTTALVVRPDTEAGILIVTERDHRSEDDAVLLAPPLSQALMHETLYSNEDAVVVIQRHLASLARTGVRTFSPVALLKPNRYRGDRDPAIVIGYVQIVDGESNGLRVVIVVRDVSRGDDDITRVGIRRALDPLDPEHLSDLSTANSVPI
jgi:hypothetical protein